MKHTLVQSFRDYSNDDLYATRGMSRLLTLRMPLITENRILPHGTHGRILSTRRLNHIWYRAPDYYARAFAVRMDSAARWEAYSSQMAGML